MSTDATAAHAGSGLEFDPFGDDFFGDPTALYRRLRDKAPVYHNPSYDFWALSRWEHVTAAHKDLAAYSSAYGTDLNFLSDPARIQYPMILFMDPPDHDRMRALVSRVFTPRAMAALEPMVRRVVSAHADAVADPHDFDAVAEWTALFPVEVISEMLGVPAGERQQIRLWVDIMLHREPGQKRPSPESEKAQMDAGLYMYNLLQEKRRHPADDMITRLTEVEVERADGDTTQLSDEEIAGFLTLLAGAGAETVTKLLGNAFVLFARNPEQWQLILDDEAVIPTAVEEILRYLPPSQYQGRYMLEDRVVDGTTIPAGSAVLLLTGSACRDERAFVDPDRFDVTRKPSLALGFGYGVHSCLGAALARSECRIAIAEMRRRWPSFEIDETGLRRVTMSNVAGYKNVPVRAA